MGGAAQQSPRQTRPLENRGLRPSGGFSVLSPVSKACAALETQIEARPARPSFLSTRTRQGLSPGLARRWCGAQRSNRDGDAPGASESPGRSRHRFRGTRRVAAPPAGSAPAAAGCLAAPPPQAALPSLAAPSHLRSFISTPDTSAFRVPAGTWPCRQLVPVGTCPRRRPHRGGPSRCSGNASCCAQRVRGKRCERCVYGHVCETVDVCARV